MSDFWNDEPSIEAKLQQVSSLILTSIEQSNPFIRELLIDRVTRGGKMIRPALVIIGSKLGETEREEEAIRLASMLEMIHLASLIHDDIIDGSRTRRGIPTLNSIVGPKQAVLAGDYLLSKALSLIKGEEGDLKASVVTNAFSRLCESELTQDAEVGNFLISSSSYLRRIGGKTAALFALSAYSGAAITLGEKYQQYLLHRIGYCLGIAFQIKDDILDYTGDAVKLGKEIGKDVHMGIPTYPLIAALKVESNNNFENRPLFELVKHKKTLSKKASKKVVALAVSLGGVEKSEEFAQKYINRAFIDIEKINNKEVQSLLVSLFTKLSSRTI
ncbi:MAG: polyprenyl synthetase family protein [Spirochaetaceae bacterium]|nr:polyprenyl synthetase family protein [Spirochaetaceae bacterium]